MFQSDPQQQQELCDEEELQAFHHPLTGQSFCLHQLDTFHMSDHRMALLPFSTLATYAPEGDQETELMAELQTETTASGKC